jgi:hypothetical protein
MVRQYLLTTDVIFQSLRTNNVACVYKETEVKRFLQLVCVRTILSVFVFVNGTRGGAVIEALRYKPEGRGIDSR